MTSSPYEAPKIADLGSLHDLAGEATTTDVFVTDDDGHSVSFSTSIGPV